MPVTTVPEVEETNRGMEKIQKIANRIEKLFGSRTWDTKPSRRASSSVSIDESTRRNYNAA
jgi:hypothetical protein